MPVEFELPDDREGWMLGVMLAERFGIVRLATNDEDADWAGWMSLTEEGAELLEKNGVGTGPRERAVLIETFLNITRDVAAEAGAPERWKEVAYYMLTAPKDEVADSIEMAKALRKQSEMMLHSPGDDLPHETV